MEEKQYEIYRTQSGVIESKVYIEKALSIESWKSSDTIEKEVVLDELVGEKKLDNLNSIEKGEPELIQDTIKIIDSEKHSENVDTENLNTNLTGDIDDATNNQILEINNTEKEIISLEILNGESLEDQDILNSELILENIAEISEEPEEIIEQDPQDSQIEQIVEIIDPKTNINSESTDISKSEKVNSESPKSVEESDQNQEDNQISDEIQTDIELEINCEEIPNEENGVNPTEKQLSQEVELELTKDNQVDDNAQVLLEQSVSPTEKPEQIDIPIDQIEDIPEDNWEILSESLIEEINQDQIVEEDQNLNETTESKRQRALLEDRARVTSIGEAKIIQVRSAVQIMEKPSTAIIIEKNGYDKGRHLERKRSSQPEIRANDDIFDLISVSAKRQLNNAKWGNILRCTISEFIGSFLLIFLGCGSIVYPESKRVEDRPNLISIVLTFGFAVICLAQAFSPVSNHFNPAVTISLMAVGKISFINAIFYVPAQCFGGAFGVYILSIISPIDLGGELGATRVHPEIGWFQAMVFEFILTFLLVMVVLNAPPGTGPIYVGSAVICALFVGGPMTMAAINPARTFGPSLISGIWENHWVYWFGPILGGLAAALVYKIIFPQNNEEDRFRRKSTDKSVNSLDL